MSSETVSSPPKNTPKQNASQPKKSEPSQKTEEWMESGSGWSAVNEDDFNYDALDEILKLQPQQSSTTANEMVPPLQQHSSTTKPIVSESKPIANTTVDIQSSTMPVVSEPPQPQFHPRKILQRDLEQSQPPRHIKQDTTPLQETSPKLEPTPLSKMSLAEQSKHMEMLAEAARERKRIEEEQEEQARKEKIAKKLRELEMKKNKQTAAESQQNSSVHTPSLIEETTTPSSIRGGFFAK